MGIGAAIGGIVGSVVGGVGNYYATKEANKAAAKQARLAREHELNILKNQVGWRVSDAMKAGLHPLAALGMNPASSSVGPAQTFAADYSQAADSLGRAIDSVADPKDKVAAAATQLMFEKTALENEYTKTQVASQRMMNMQMAAPGVPGGNPNPETMSLPGYPDVRWNVNNPNAAQKAEDTYGEIGGEFMGILAAANDANRYLKFENILTAGDYGYQAGEAARQYLLDSAVAKDIAKGGYKSNHLGGR